MASYLIQDTCLERERSYSSADMRWAYSTATANGTTIDQPTKRSSIWPINWTLTGTTISCQCESRVNGNEEVLHISQSFRNGASPSDGIVSNSGVTCHVLFFLAFVCVYVYTYLCMFVCVYIYIYIYIYVCVCVCVCVCVFPAWCFRLRTCLA